MLIAPDVLEEHGFRYQLRSDWWDHEDTDVTIYAGSEGSSIEEALIASYRVGFSRGRSFGAQEVRNAIKDALGLNNTGEI